VYDSFGLEVRVKPGEAIQGVDLPYTLVQALYRSPHELEISEHRADMARPGGAVVIDGMYGIGDNLHQRAILRELMKREEVWLHTSHWHVYHDLIGDRLHLIFKDTRLRAQAKTIARERGLFGVVPAAPASAHHIKLWYKKPAIDHYGTILQAMAGAISEQGHPVDHLKPLDFSLPVPGSWRAPAFDTGGKPLLVYRPIVLRREWNSANRNPDPEGYETLYKAAKDGYFVVSIADLQPGEEWIVGPEPEADLKFHGGELTFQSMAALFKQAAIVFCNAGFAPVLAQAVGTPSICVYGGRESYRTTQRAGAHLAPTLGIDPIQPCDCHTERHDCGDKKIDLPPALDRVREFAAQWRTSLPKTTPAAGPTEGAGAAPPPEGGARSRTLIFGTTYVDSADRQKLTVQWLFLHRALNPDCDFLLVDSASPLPIIQPSNGPRCEVFQFGDNVGHLSRKGRDGWGRAFTKGLDLAVERGYEFVAHIEGDSLLRLPVRNLVADMVKWGKPVASIPVSGMERDFAGWVETGLMAFSVDWVKRNQFTQRYDWPHREVRPTPEVVVRGIVGDPNLYMLPIKGWRGDKHQITNANVVALDLDWVTHCHNDVFCYDRFVEAALVGREAVSPLSSSSRVDSRTALIKLNLGCGDNKLPGWENHDSDVDIARPLPWRDNSASYIFIEHCVEHVSCHEAIRFFEEAFRVLAPGGILRVTVPSIEKIMACDDQAYFEFTKKWSGEASAHGAAKAILFSHGHQMAWTVSVMASLLRYAGFSYLCEREVGQSPHPELRGVEGHGKVIGDVFNKIESMAFEAAKPGAARISAELNPRLAAESGTRREQTGNFDGQALTKPIAVVVGGGGDVLHEVEQTRALLDGVQATWFVINDMISEFDGDCVGVTLHPNKAKDWLSARARTRRLPPSQVWAHTKGDRRHPFAGITDVADDWRGSSGLFAVAVARQLGYDRIILAGVPMTKEGGHFKRGPGHWNACDSFRLAWDNRRTALAPFLRSWSGWTREAFGEPDLSFIGLAAKAA
jgi:hypothetical protein